MESKKIITTFYLSEFEEEEKWLEVQHNQGWKLADISGKQHNLGWKRANLSGNTYVFEKCANEEWIYQLDFRGKEVNRAEYIQLFADCGWEFVLEKDKWFYFRKRKDATDVDTSIFSDRDSKIDMCERAIYGRLSINVCLFALSGIIVFLAIFTDIFRSSDFILFPTNAWLNDFLKAAIPWIAIGLWVACSYSFHEYRKIKKRIDSLKNPIK